MIEVIIIVGLFLLLDNRFYRDLDKTRKIIYFSLTAIAFFGLILISQGFYLDGLTKRLVGLFSTTA